MTAYTPDPYPNQTFVFNADGDVYRFSLRTIRGLLYATLRDDDDNVLVGSVRCVNRRWLLPFRRNGGNFRFEDDNGQYPDYSNFGGSCRLVYYDADEIASGGV